MDETPIFALNTGIVSPPERSKMLDELLSAGATGSAPERLERSTRMDQSSADNASEDKLTLTSFERFRVPIGGQEIELQQLDYAHGGISLLRLRIREGKRFTIFDIDPVTARHWGEALTRWAQTQATDSTAAAG